ncbi:AAA family ATPase [Amycolatopsis sp. NBC_00345]|uniref:AAA family ATPase n=1 Tax=Amycolatopsis sp. NBC_00345 TaxID=2975955 RepID=UPI002E26EE7B
MVLNGPPAVGKSTLAGRYADEHRPALALDIDKVRALIGGWREDPSGAGLAARELAVAAARAHLEAGHDVVVPQLLGRVEFLDRLEVLAQETGAAFHEIVLWDTKDEILRRFAERPPRPEHADTAPAEVAALYDRLASLLEARSCADVVQVSAGRVDDAYRAFLSCLD